MKRVVVASLVLTFCSSIGVADVPRDLRLHAHFSPGGGPGQFDDTSLAAMARWSKPWDLKLDATGDAKRTFYVSVIRGNVLDSQPVHQTVRVRPQALEALVTAIRQADFFSLPTFASGEPMEHSGGAVLTVTLGGRTHKVTVYSASTTEITPAVTRLRQVWRALFRAVPSPNQNRELSWLSGDRHTI